MARKSKFSEAQIIEAIKEIEAGATMKDVARRVGVSGETPHRWRTKYGGMTVSEAQDKRRLEDENRRLRELVARFALEVESLTVAKRVVMVSRRREVVKLFQSRGHSEREACQ